MIRKKYYSISGNTARIYAELQVPEYHDRIMLENIQIPKSYYLLPSTAKLDIDGKEYDFLEGNYNTKSFKTTFATTVPGWSIAIPNHISERDTGKYTITAPDNDPHTLSTDNTYLAQMLGIIVETQYDITTTFTFPNVVNFNPLDVIHFKCSAVQLNNNLLSEVYTTTAQYNSSIQYYNFSATNDRYFFPIAQYEFYLTDIDNHEIQLNGNTWTATISTFKRDTDLTTLKNEMLELSDILKNVIRYNIANEENPDNKKE